MPRTIYKVAVFLAMALGLSSHVLADPTITVSGSEQLVSGSWDAGTISVSFSDSVGNKYQETLTYGQFSTAASIASGLGGMFSRDYLPNGLCAVAVGAVVTFHLRGGAAFNVPTISAPSTSFALTTSGWQVAPIVTWPPPAAINYGTALSSTQLNATANTAGTFAYSPVSGTDLTAGSHTLSVTFTPTDTTDYTTTTVSVPIVVNKVTPTITWAPPANVVPGTTLSSTQLDATASVAGAYVYSPAAGTSLTAGALTLSVTFTPTDTTDYNSATASVPLIISAAPNAGIISDFAGNGTLGYAGNGGLAPQAELDAPTGVAVDGSNNVYIVDTGNNVVRKVTASTGDISTVAGGGGGCGNQSSIGDGCSATSGTLNEPIGVAVDSSGNIYIADMLNARIREVTFPNGPTNPGVINTVAGGGSGCGNQSPLGDGCLATQAIFSQTMAGVAVDTIGNIYISDRGNYDVRKVMASTGIISTAAGTGTRGVTCVNGVATSTPLFVPGNVAVDNGGNIYIADTGCLTIREVVASTGNLVTVAGGGTSGIGNGGSATNAQLYPNGIAVDSKGNLLIADAQYDLIRLVTASNGLISAVAGGAGNGPYCSNQTDAFGDGCQATAVAINPGPVAVGASGNLYFAEGQYNHVRVVGAVTEATLTVSSSAAPSTFSQPVTLTATFSAGGPTGAVTFYDSGTPIGAGSIIGTTATFTTSTLSTGTHVITAGWAGDSDFNPVTSASFTQVVNMATPVLDWPAPQPVFYGTALSATQFDATASIPGTFTYSPPSGTVPTVGSHTLSVSFVPTDQVDYAPISATVALTVNQATPAIMWKQPADIATGTALSATQLQASSPVAGALVYSPPLGTMLGVGPHILTVTLTPDDTTDYLTATASVYIAVTEATGIADTGTITLTVNGVTAATTSYNGSSTPTTIAAGLAACAAGQAGGPPGCISQNPPVTVTAVDDAIYLESNTAGSSIDYGYTLQTTSYDSTDFSQPSFVYPTITGTLQAGTASSSGTTVYSYCVPGPSNPNCSATSSGYDGVGNLLNSVDSVMGTWSYQYDTLNRLSTAQNTATTSTSTQYVNNYGCWKYDAFGNRLSEAISTTACANNPPLTSWGQLSTANNNQFTSTNKGAVNYDPAGDVINDGVNQYLYDAEGRICAVAGSAVPGTSTMTGYLYGADGRRVAKGTITAWSCDPSVNGFQTTNDFIVDLAGNQMTEMGVDANNTLAWQHTNVFAAGRLIATYDNNGLHFYFDDPLGTRRAQTDYAGVIEQSCVSLPFGDQLNCAGPSGSLQYPTEHHFTGKERDSESGLDYFDARYYGSSIGRFTSPDWASNFVPIPFGKYENPQTFNLYAYVQNNPLSRIDKNGHDDYTYDQSGKQIKVVKRSWWHNFWVGNTYTMNLTAGGSISLYGPINPLPNGQQYTIVSPAETTKAATDFVNEKAGAVAGMTLDQFKQASKNNQPLDFKRQLSATSLYMWSDGKAYDLDGVGNITWGYLSTVAVNGSITNEVAHLGAAYAQVFIDKTSKPEWIFSHTLGDRPQDYDAINAGRKWGGEDMDRLGSQVMQTTMSSPLTGH